MPPFVATPPNFTNLKNNVSSALALAMASNDTSLTVTAGTGVSFPTAPFYVSVEFEVMLCTNKAGDVFTITRGQDGTTAVAHIVNSVVECRDTAVIIRDAYNGVNSAFSAINGLGAGAADGTALPVDVVYLARTQELTHKTIDLSDGSKQNVIIGNVQPDPAALVYQNILLNGGFDDWSTPLSVTMPAGIPTSGNRQAPLIPGWNIQGNNDSAITATRDTANIDPANPSGYDMLLNVSTVQGADSVGIFQNLNPGTDLAANDLKKIVGQPVSISLRVKGISGNVQVRFTLYTNDGTDHGLSSTFTQVTNGSYITVKFENQIFIPNVNAVYAGVYIDLKGVGQVALDSVMMIIGNVATTHRPLFPSITNKRLASDVQRANLAVNGGFEVWQRGNGPFSNPPHFADGWGCGIAGGDTFTITADGSNLWNGSQWSAKVVFVKGAGGSNISQAFSGVDRVPFFSKQITISAMVKTTTANAVRVGVYDGNKWNLGGYHSGSGQFEMLTATATILGGASLVTYGVQFDLSCTAYIDNVMLVFGATPADYVPQQSADELARCLRYYEIVGTIAGQDVICGSIASSASLSAWITVPFKAMKGVTPTVTKLGTWTVANCAQPTVNVGSIAGIILNIVSAAAGQFYTVNNTAGSGITAEANS